MAGTIGARARKLPLFWMLLLPFLALLLVVGAAGTLLVVRDVSARANAQLDRELSTRSLDVRTVLHDRELYVLESVNFASNLKGMAEAIRARDIEAVSTLLGSVLALKGDLDVLVITDRQGRRQAGFGARGDGKARWAALVRAALNAGGGRTSAIIRAGDGEAVVAIAGAVCERARPCDPIGVAVAGMSLNELVAEALSRSPQASARGITILDPKGEPLASAGVTAPSPNDFDPGAPSVRVHPTDADTATMYSPFSVQGKRVGTIAVTMPKEAAFASVRGAGFRVAAIILAAMLGIVLIGALLSRSILRQVRPLVHTSRALGRGEREARAPVITDNELGELARGLNQMAEQLQASYETLESRVEQRTEEVRRLLAERTEFFASMSHELRTPLAVILSEADLLTLAGGPVPADEARDTGATIRASGDQLLSVINEVLQLARAEAGRVDVELGPVRIADVMKKLKPTIDGLARANDLTVHVKVPKDLPVVIADPRRLYEVLLNLVDNAVKYTPEGGSVILSAAEAEGQVMVTVADTGVGIPPQAGDRIFEPFFRVEGIRPLRGQASTGLGLALAKRFLEAQGGTLTFESTVGIGTSFSFKLQRAPRGGGKQRPARQLQRT